MHRADKPLRIVCEILALASRSSATSLRTRCRSRSNAPWPGGRTSEKIGLWPHVVRTRCSALPDRTYAEPTFAGCVTRSAPELRNQAIAASSGSVTALVASRSSWAVDGRYGIGCYASTAWKASLLISQGRLL